MKKNLLLAFLFLVSLTCVQAKDYFVSDFGAKGDGHTLDTRSIQKAIDFANENGGGRVVLTPGNYLSGSIYIKSNVTLHIEGGATLHGSTNPFDYIKDPNIRWTSLIFAYKQENIGITGKGIINGHGFITANNMIKYIQKGICEDPLTMDRPNETNRPQNIYLRECKNVTITGISLRDPASWCHTYDQCVGLRMDDVHVEANSYWNNDGLDVVDCQDVVITNSVFNAADDAICFKSHSDQSLCKNILVRDCIGRSGASGIKFGTVGAGGFVDIHLKNITIYDTYRSAFTIQAVDGARAENISVDSLYAINTGNAIFLRVGDRWTGKRNHSKMENISISNVYVQVPAGKPDKGYRYEGPIHHNPRNVSPSSIVGLPGHAIKNVLLKNITIEMPGGADKYYAYRGTSPAELDSIPEMANAYPEYSQWRELPAWGFYIRHAEDVTFDNVKLIAKKKDYRPAIVVDDLKRADFKGLTIVEPDSKGKEQYIIYKSLEITK